MRRFSIVHILSWAAMIWWIYGAHASTVDQLLDAAKREGVIEFLAPSTLGPQGGRALGEAFNRKYGLNIKVNYSVSNVMPRDVAKLITQAATGAPPEWDVVVVMDAHHASLWLKKLHQTFDYKKLGVDPKMINYDGGTIAFANQFVFPAYNKKILAAKDVPRSWEDLLDPKWKGGKLGMSNAVIHPAMLAAGPWGERRTTDYVKALAKQELSLGTLGELYTRLQMGEVLIAVTLTDSYIHQAKEKDAPIVHADGLGPGLSPAYNAGVPKGAPHPNGGHLFAAFLTTPEAQEIWEKYGGQSSAFIPGTAAYRYAQGRQLIYMTQDKAVLVDRLAREYARTLGFK